MTQHRLSIAVAFFLFAFSASYIASAGMLEGTQAFEAGDFDTAYRELLPVAEAGSASAQEMIAQLYESGSGIEKNVEEALVWHQRAAEQGSATATYRLGNIYRLGEYGETDLNEAKKWYLVASKKFHSNSEYYLGLMHLYKPAGMYDFKKGIYWLKRCAGWGHTDCQYHLGLEFLRPKNENIDEAVEWIARASDQHHIEAKFRLARLYYHGNFVDRDLFLALMYWADGVWTSLFPPEL